MNKHCSNGYVLTLEDVGKVDEVFGDEIEVGMFFPHIGHVLDIREEGLVCEKILRQLTGDIRGQIETCIEQNDSQNKWIVHAPQGKIEGEMSLVDLLIYTYYPSLLSSIPRGSKKWEESGFGSYEEMISTLGAYLYTYSKRELGIINPENLSFTGLPLTQSWGSYSFKLSGENRHSLITLTTNTHHNLVLINRDIEIYEDIVDPFGRKVNFRPLNLNVRKLFFAQNEEESFFAYLLKYLHQIYGADKFKETVQMLESSIQENFSDDNRKGMEPSISPLIEVDCKEFEIPSFSESQRSLFNFTNKGLFLDESGKLMVYRIDKKGIPNEYLYTFENQEEIMEILKALLHLSVVGVRASLSLFEKMLKELSFG